MTSSESVRRSIGSPNPPRWRPPLTSSRWLTAGLTVFVTSVAQAQRQSQTIQVPANLRPPAGMCRIWLDRVPAAQQPAPTSCDAAVRNRPPNGRVIFGDDYVDQRSKKGDLGLKGVVPLPKSDARTTDPRTVDKKADPRKPDEKTTPRKPPPRDTVPDRL